jgi:hypothetical protein
MNRFAAILGVGAVVLGVSAASAQIAPQPLPPVPDGIMNMTFPAPAARYEKFVQYFLTIIRQAPTRFHITQGDTDLLVLVVKDCAARVEADGWVTKHESKYCEKITTAKIHELMAPYVIQQAGGN